MEAIPRDACLGNDDAVIATNDDASTCKRCAVDLGYWSDPYIHYFVKSTDRKAPEINRGYYARTIAIQSLVEKFIDDSGRVVKEFYELDFPSVTSRKCLYIQRSKPLLQGISHEDHDIKLNRNNLHAYNYKLIGVDLRNLKEVEEKLKESDIEFQIPTIFLAECVLVYMNITKSSQLLRWITQSFKSVLFINYEMEKTLLGFVSLSFKDFILCINTRNVIRFSKRFTKEGWAGAEASDMLSIWGRLPPEEISRVTQIEMLDEQELLLQLFSHYCITLAWNDSRWAEVQL
ncbi:Leucine carboxyl methyltransferase 1 [Armadillidium vulgare]|nr:Leucine carboxyl methyltransferase 1 [Armadillidium vulgare]